MSPEVKVALNDLRLLLDERLDTFGGYPAEMAIVAEGKLIAIADVDENGEPELVVISVEKFLAVWRKVAAAEDKDEGRRIAERLYEAGYPGECLAEMVDPDVE
jgi:hypothetical protein